MLEAARAFIAEAQRTFAALSAFLAERWPDQDVGALRYAVRTHMPLVQVPTADAWCFPLQPDFTLAETWLGKLIDPNDHLDDLIRVTWRPSARPASPTSWTWSGLSELKPAFERLVRSSWSTATKAGVKLFDLPHAPIPGADVPAPCVSCPSSTTCCCRTATATVW